MIFDLLTPPQGPRGWGQNFFAVAHSIHVSEAYTKLGWISSNGLKEIAQGTETIIIYPSLFKKAWGLLFRLRVLFMCIVVGQGNLI